MSLEHLEKLILDNLKSPLTDFWAECAREAKDILFALQASVDADGANKAWFLEKISLSRGGYIRCFEQILKEEYYEAWCGLEQVEIALKWLSDNPFYDPKLFDVNILIVQVERWQELFPYAVFFSPGILNKEQRCSICDSIIDPWSDCGHVVGRVYAGNECLRIVTKMELIEISLVRDPVQKYSVARGMNDENGNLVDLHDYSMVHFPAERIHSPFDGWRMYWTRVYHPHSMFPNATSEGLCPCESGRSYKHCCERKPGILRPHAEFEFEKPLVATLPSTMFAGYGERNGPATLTYAKPDAPKDD